jgi:hypothetical protein
VRGGAADTDGGEAQTRRGLRGEHRSEEVQLSGKEKRPEAHRNGGSTVRVESGQRGGGRRPPVDGNELRWILQHEGGMGSEEGLMVKDDNDQRWELTVRELKRQRWLRLRCGERRSSSRLRPEVTRGGQGGGGGALLVGVVVVRRGKKVMTAGLAPF